MLGESERVPDASPFGPRRCMTNDIVPKRVRAREDGFTAIIFVIPTPLGVHYRLLFFVLYCSNPWKFVAMGKGKTQAAESKSVGAHLQRKRDALRASILAARASIVRAQSASG
jgi:hypothetical protein